MQNDVTPINRNWPAVVILFLFSLFLMQIAGADGILRIPNFPGDASWFFMGGKSWMAGLTPYRDFTDSKGPLVWLIYGIGYLISGQSLRGMIVLEILAYWLNFYILYKTALLLKCNKSQAIIAAMSISILYFYPGLHLVMRIEDYCHILQSTAFYILVKIFIIEKWKTKYAFILGICCGCCLMMKYAYFLTLLVPCGVVWIFLFIKRHEPWRGLLYFFLGNVAIVLPFIIYFLCVGALRDFIQEYFINTGYTIINVKHHFDTYTPTFRQRWPYKIWYMLRGEDFWGEFLRFIFLGLVISIYVFRRKIWMIVALILWYVASVVLFATVDGEAYYLTLCILVYGGLCRLVSLFKSITLNGAILYGGCYLAFVAILTTHYVNSEFHHTDVDIKRHENLNRAAAIINSFEIQAGRRPTITNLKKGEAGEHIPTNAVAGTKYYAYQSGMTEEMEERHIEEVFSSHPDFVIIKLKELDLRQRLEKEGYKLQLVYTGNPHPNPAESEPDCLYLYIGNGKQ